jgi:uncharacterized protein (TIGR03067 family)
MIVRFSIAFLVALSLTALAPAAPAPLVKPERRKVADDMSVLQGTWKLVEQGRPGMNARLGGGRAVLIRRDTNVKIRISGNKFTYLYNNGLNNFSESTSYEMKVEQRTAPKSIDMTYSSPDNSYTMTMKGIYKVEGNKVTILYVQVYSGNIKVRLGNGASEDRPASFDNPPVNAMQLVLERE